MITETSQHQAKSEILQDNIIRGSKLFCLLGGKSFRSICCLECNVYGSVISESSYIFYVYQPTRKECIKMYFKLVNPYGKDSNSYSNTRIV